MKKKVSYLLITIFFSATCLGTFKSINPSPRTGTCLYGGHRYPVHSKPTHDTVCTQVGDRFEVVIDASSQSYLYDDVEHNQGAKTIDENNGTVVEVDFDLSSDQVTN